MIFYRSFDYGLWQSFCKWFCCLCLAVDERSCSLPVNDMCWFWIGVIFNNSAENAAESSRPVCSRPCPSAAVRSLAVHSFPCSFNFPLSSSLSLSVFVYPPVSIPIVPLLYSPFRSPFVHIRAALDYHLLSAAVHHSSPSFLPPSLLPFHRLILSFSASGRVIPSSLPSSFSLSSLHLSLL